MNSRFRFVLVAFLSSVMGNSVFGLPQTSLNLDPDLSEEIVCVEGDILDMAVQYEGNASTAVYDVSNVTLDVTDNAGTIELVWSMTADENPTGPGVPTGDYKLPMSCSTSTFGMDDPVEGSYGGGTWSGDDDNGLLQWTTATDPIDISGKVTIIMSKLPNAFTFSFNDGSEMHVYLVADCGSGNPGPVDHIPPTTPDGCGEGGGGDDDCPGGGGGCGGGGDEPGGPCILRNSPEIKSVFDQSFDGRIL